MLAKAFFSGNENEQEFKRLSERIVGFLKADGLMRLPYSHPSLPYFSRLSNEKKSIVLERLSLYLDACSDTISQTGSLKDSKSFTQQMFKKIDAITDPDFFEKINDDHVVEIYSSDNCQIFRNLKFFEISSYTLEDLYCREWWDLYKRDDEITKKIFLVASQIYSSELNVLIDNVVEAHQLEETNSPFMYKMNISLNTLSPVIIENKISGLCAIENVYVTNKIYSMDREEQLLQDYYSRTSVTENENIVKISDL